MIEAYPLHWPDGWTRTPSHLRDHSRFKSSLAKARDELLDEVRMLRGRYHHGNEPVLSTNIELKLDGLPYANRRAPVDPGVAIYFKYNDKDMCFACDKYLKVWENMVAIKHTISAIRGIERWGASDMMERAFKGFVALEHNHESWREILQVSTHATLDDCEQSYKRLRSKYHPDHGGTAEEFHLLNQAISNARAVL